jgi:hypothetical protein
MMSIGFACDQVGGSTASSRARSSGLSARSGTPASAAASAAITPAPPPLVIKVKVSSRLLPKRASVSAAMNRSCSVSTRSMPARRITASITTSDPAIAPVCDAAACSPLPARPALTTITGLLRAAARAADMNLRGASIDSMYSRMERVRPSLARWSSRSPKSTSACSPSEIMCEKPTRRDLAQSSTAVTSAPDCDTKATSPSSASVCAKLAFRPRRGVSSPRQFGPSTRSRCGFAAASIACFCAALNPAVITMAARVPRRPSSPIRSAMLSGGVHSTARSGGCGRSATCAYTGWPSSTACFGFTA